jgi:hypothetical protein
MSSSFEHNRTVVDLFSPDIKEVLPEYFVEDNEKLIQLLQEYYNWMDSSADHNFPDIITGILTSRDIHSVDEKYLDQIINEIGNGLTQSSFFDNPRLMGRLLGDFYRVKGTRVGTEGFFRAFFGEDVIIEYPKENIFVVGEDKIGYESIRFIQDDKQYQVFSILLKLGLSTVDYETLYKKFAHPAGYHFLGVIQTQTSVELGPNNTGLSAFTVDFTDSAELYNLVGFTSETNLTLGSVFEPMTALFDSGSGYHRASLVERLSKYMNLSLTQLNNFYGDIDTWVEPNSFTFDDSSAYPRPDVSMTTETMDNDWFTRIGSDSVY